MMCRIKNYKNVEGIGKTMWGGEIEEKAKDIKSQKKKGKKKEKKGAISSFLCSSYKPG